MDSCSCHGRLAHLVLCSLIITTALTIVIFHQVLVEKTSQTKLYRIHEKQSQQCVRTLHFNVAVWDKDVCERMFENLGQFPKFPSHPDHYDCKNNLTSVVENTDAPSIKRIQSYLRPKESGFYKFRVRSDVALRIFLETSLQSPEIIVILESSRRQNDVVHSKDYLLMSNHFYYFELVLFCLPGDNYFDIDWLVPGSVQFRPIESRDFMPGRPMVPSQHPLFTVKAVLSPNQHILIGFIPRIHTIKSFPPCSSENFRTSIVTPDTVVYTPRNTPTRDIEKLIQFITRSFQKAVPSKYPSIKIMKVESIQNSTFDLRRLLVDLELVVDGLDYKQRMSEYFFNWNNDSSDLCRPSHYHWNHLVTVNFVYLADCYDESLSVWAHYFIQNMIEILETSLDVNLKVIITTCDEKAARSYDSVLRSSGFDRYAVVLLEGGYTHSRGMRAALSLVKDDDSIVVLCESRVKMPTMIVEEIRKHTFNNTMAYSPVPFQLECGYFPGGRQVKGEWCKNCGALLSMYKDDWKRVLKDGLGEPQLSNDGTRSDGGFLKDKVLSHISNFGIEISMVKLNDLYRL